MNMIKGNSRLSMLALTGALAVAAAATAGPEPTHADYKPASKHRERVPSNKRAGSKLARKAARGKL
jgi:hypothetical protein